METSLLSGGGLTFHGRCSGRDSSDDGSLAVGVRFQRGQRSAGRGRTSGALLIIHYAFGCFTLMVFFLVFYRAQR
jgi:hypothetical protein